MPRTKPRLDPSTLSAQGPGVVEDQVGTQALLDKIEEMRCSDQFAWADDTLKGIYDSIESNRRWTSRQVVALNNIRFARHWDDIEEEELRA